MPQVRANGIDIEYESFGRASDPLILLIMGFARATHLLARSSVRRLGGQRLSRRAVRQPRHRQVDPFRRPIRSGPSRAACGGGGGETAGRSLYSGRHGRRRSGPHGRPRDKARPCRRRLDGRHDRPIGCDQPSGPGQEPHLDHVHHRTAGPAGGEPPNALGPVSPAKQRQPRRSHRGEPSRAKGALQSGLSGQAKRRCARGPSAAPIARPSISPASRVSRRP